MDKLKNEAKLFAKFSLVGAFNAVWGYSLIFFFMFLGMNPYLSNAICYGIGLIASFFLNKNLVFRSEKKHLTEFLKFFITFLFAYSLNLVILHTLLRFNYNSYLSQFLAGGVYTMTFYLSSRIWVFK